jgi:hypothetical protein
MLNCVTLVRAESFHDGLGGTKQTEAVRHFIRRAEATLPPRTAFTSAAAAQYVKDFERYPPLNIGFSLDKMIYTS